MKKRIFEILGILCILISLFPITTSALNVTASNVHGIEDGKTYCEDMYFTLEVLQNGMPEFELIYQVIPGTVYNTLTPDPDGKYKLESGLGKIRIYINYETADSFPLLEVTVNAGHTDETPKDHVCDFCEKIISECSGGTATCKDKAICAYCEEFYGEKDSSNHVGEMEVRNAKNATCTEDGYTGDTYCLGCDAKLYDGEAITKLDHIDVDKNHVCDRENCEVTTSSHSGGTATCKDKAICAYCEEFYGEKDSNNHAGGTEVRNAKDATCTEDGYTGDTYCKGCDTKLSDGKSVDKTGHDYESKVTKEATTTSIGTKTYTCKNCGHSYEEEIAKLPNKITSPKTGDETPLSMMVAIMVLSAMMLAAFLMVNKKYSND